jgi:hypothetical protein
MKPFRKWQKEGGFCFGIIVEVCRKEAMRQQIEEEGSVWYTSSRMIDDGVIDPRDTR